MRLGASEALVGEELVHELERRMRLALVCREAI